MCNCMSNKTNVYIIYTIISHEFICFRNSLDRTTRCGKTVCSTLGEYPCCSEDADKEGVPFAHRHSHRWYQRPEKVLVVVLERSSVLDLVQDSQDDWHQEPAFAGSYFNRCLQTMELEDNKPDKHASVSEISYFMFSTNSLSCEHGIINPCYKASICICWNAHYKKLKSITTLDRKVNYEVLLIC